VPILRVLAALAGAATVLLALVGVLRAFVVARGARDPLTRVVFVPLSKAFRSYANLRTREQEKREAILTYFAPVSLLAVPAVWLVAALLGYAGIFWAINQDGFGSALVVSGSSLFTLGFAHPDGVGSAIVAFAAAAVGIAVLAIVISYLPSLNAALTRRETLLAMLDARAGRPATVITLWQRHLRYGGISTLDDAWPEWERWIVDLGESHYTHPILTFFRSTDAQRSWLSATLILLDAANMRLAAVQDPGRGNASAWMFLHAGTGTLQRLADYFRLAETAGPSPLERPSFDAALRTIETEGVPLVADTDQAWVRFRDRRREYATPIAQLAKMLDTPLRGAWA
jgi:hypothetical protein